MSKPRIYKSNALIEASYRLSLYEQRIILSCISQVRRDEKLTDQKIYTITVKDLSDNFGVKSDRAYNLARQACEKLFDRRVTLYEEPNGGNAGKVRLTRWVQEIIYHESSGEISLRFSHAMVPYLSQLTEQFTHYPLEHISRITSPYTMRLFEFLAQWKKTGYREINIDWLRKILQLEEKYPAVKDLKKWVIEPSVSQINKITPMKVEWEQKKTGRKITHFIFKFKYTDEEIDKTYNTEARNTGGAKHGMFGIPASVIERYSQPGDSWQDAAIRALDSKKSL
jgi:plasmid replication initiation protein|tara:strand:- start:1408 stop:2253 length:846 start_codon:yes stop_codon:yes gene_type:complete